MTTTKSKKTAEPHGTLEREEIPDAFRQRCDAGDGNVKAGYETCKRHGREPALAIKKRRDRHQHEWRSYVQGGGVADDEKRIGQYGNAIAATRGRLDRAVDPVLRGNLEKSIISLERQRETLREVVAAAGPGGRVNQKSRQSELASLRHKLNGLEARRKRFDDGRFPVPDDLADSILKVQSELSRVGSEFWTVAKELEASSRASQEAGAGERAALCTTLNGVLQGLGVRVLELYDKADPGRLYEFPRSAPVEGDALFKQANEVAGVAERLGRRNGMEVFWKAVGDVGEYILSMRLSLQSFPALAPVRRASEKDADLSRQLGVGEL